MGFNTASAYDGIAFVLDNLYTLREGVHSIVDAVDVKSFGIPRSKLCRIYFVLRRSKVVVTRNLLVIGDEYHPATSNFI